MSAPKLTDEQWQAIGGHPGDFTRVEDDQAYKAQDRHLSAIAGNLGHPVVTMPLPRTASDAEQPGEPDVWYTLYGD